MKRTTVVSIALAGLMAATLALAPHRAFANDSDEAKLKALKAEISKLQQWLDEANTEQSRLSKSLQKTDKDIGATAREVEKIRQQLQQEQNRLKKLQQDQAQLDELRSSHTRRLREQLQAAQKLGSDGPIKALLNQTDPQEAQRMMKYFGYFNQARVEQIHTTIAELQRLSRIEEEILAQQRQLQQTQSTLDQRSATLADQKRQQQQLLAKLQTQVSSEKQRLQQKQADRKRLEALLDEVQTLVEKSPRKNDARPFKSLKRKLPQPLAGRVVAAFGNPNSSGAGNWEGWLIAAPEGQPIRAVHHGRVVYSNWLRGFGLLMIIDHGDGYMTLYAHNQTLMYDVGDWVNSGDIIGAVGRSGGLTEPRLYFEIRYQGRPQDPAAWLARK
ncbi:murein hydrolase activator EnvC family protein [Oceanobacter kriegii]|uniref:murein hydrolase activator EnvC family protein n=1 Tax=Oceanobacter kriegii TaxID=64972 RepID=UPI00040F7A55|nr:peptidoglycan DD-metalloendopeptidase family protein [Oceanobacter kriegii]